jgi:cytochrome b561
MKSTYNGSGQASQRYTWPAILLHWTIAVLIIGMVGLGWYMLSIEDTPGSDWFFNLHKSIGLVLVLLILLRVGWRINHRPHALPLTIPRGQATASTASHILLYITMIALPIIGIGGAIFSKSGLILFGLVLPPFAEPNHDVSEIFFSVHSFTAWILVVLVSIHVLAALKHLAINKDGVFQRMWFIQK